MNRAIIFEGISNARDLGGLKTKDGRTIRSHALIRSAKLSSANHRDEKKLKDEYRLKKIIDLRTPAERKDRMRLLMAQNIFLFRYSSQPLKASLTRKKRSCLKRQADWHLSTI